MKLLMAGISPIACETWTDAPISSPASGPPNATEDHYRAVVSVPADMTARATFDRVRERLFAYDVFPSWLIGYRMCPSGPIAPDVTIVQRILLGLFTLEMAVRVIDAWHQEDGDNLDAGFTYATVQGHPERGIATFRVRLDADRQVEVLIDALSSPGLLLTRIGRPFARLFQRTLTKAALRRLART